MKILDSDLKYYSAAILNSELKEVNIDQTSAVAHENAGQVIVDSKLNKVTIKRYFSSISSDIDDSIVDNSTLFYTNVAEKSIIIDSLITGDESDSKMPFTNSTSYNSGIRAAGFVKSGANDSSIDAGNINKANFNRTYVVGFDISNTNLLNNHVNFGENYSGGLSSNKTCSIYPAPPFPPNSDIPWRIDYWCGDYGGYTPE